jgi:hypothetical protein
MPSVWLPIAQKRKRLASHAILFHNKAQLKKRTSWLPMIAVAAYSTSLLGEDFVWTQSSAPNKQWQFITSSSDGTRVLEVQNM